MRCLLAVLTAILILVSGAGVASADQKDPRLDQLFGQLQVVGTRQEAHLVEQLIWAVWLESDSDTVNLLVERGLRAMSDGDLETALGVFDNVVDIAPDYAEGWNKRATVYFLMGRYRESIADVEKTLALEPRHFGALSGLGMIHGQLQDPAGALDAFERALAVNPHLPQAKALVPQLKKKVRGERI
jgi:tetratricopeptide (TPR) repeat protein